MEFGGVGGVIEEDDEGGYGEGTQHEAEVDHVENL